jgi:hypothetical protein
LPSNKHLTIESRRILAQVEAVRRVIRPNSW